MTKNLLWSLAESERERKSFEKFLKKWFEQVKSEFLKSLFSKFDWPKQQFRLIETDRDSLKILNAISIDQKNRLDQSKHRGTKIFLGKTQFWKNQRHILETPQSIEIDEQNAWVCDVMFFKKQSFKPSFPKIEIIKYFP